MREIHADEALVVQIEAPDLDWGFGYEELCDLGDELQEAIGEAGDVECADLSADDSSLWCFGSSAEEMLARGMPILEGHATDATSDRFIAIWAILETKTII